MIRLYVILTTVQRCLGGSACSAAVVLARSEEEAVGKGIAAAIKEYPCSKGYYCHDVKAIALNDDAVRFAALQLDRKAGEA